MKHFLSLVILFCVIESQAQDVIYKKDKTKVEAKVLEVGISDVKYKPTANPDGPTYIISKSEIATIVFQNGTFEVFSNESSAKRKSDSISAIFCRDYIGVDIAQFATMSIGIAYEHIFGKKGMLALRIPFATGLQHGQYYYYRNGKTFGTGFDLLCFPTGQGVLRYFVAPYFEWGMFRYRSYSYYNYSSYADGNHFAAGIKNGLQYKPTLHFSFSADFGFGLYSDRTRYNSSEVEPHFQANLMVGYRF